MGAGLLVEEGYELFFAAAAGVGDRFLGACRVVVEGRVGFDSRSLRDGFSVAGFAVDFGYKDGGLVLEVCGEFLPGGGELFAVCTVVSFICGVSGL